MLNSISNKLKKTAIFKAFYRVWSLPKLPAKINIIYNHIYFRILRVIGGFSFILLISKIFDSFPNNIQLVITIIAFIHITQMTIMWFIKFIYAMYIMIYHPELLEVRK